jgi:hypothetical protein
MKDFLIAVWQFAVALLDQWGALMTGGIVIASLALWERRRNKPVSWNVYFSLVLVFFSVRIFSDLA